MATPTKFRRIALGLPEALESSHFEQPDFRIKGKIFAGLGDGKLGTVKLTPEQQEVLMQGEPGIFTPAAGAWGRKGWTHVKISAADEVTLKSAITTAWLNVAPKKLAAEFRKEKG
jgi:hypothetical protein